MRKELLNKTIIILLIVGILLLLIYGIISLFQTNSNPDIDIEIYSPSEVKLGEPSNYTIVVSNNGNTDLFNVSVNDTYGFTWRGDLGQSDSKTFNIEYNGQYKDGEVIEVFVNGYSKEGEHVWDNDSWTLTVINGSYDIIEAHTRGYVSVEFTGTGYCSGDVIELRITPQIEVGFEIVIKAGLFLINSGFGQNMIIGETITLDIKPKIEIEIEIEVYCLDYDKDNPTSSETFNLQVDTSSYPEDVINLMKSLGDVPSWNKSITAVQIGVWVITDNISEEEIPFDYSEEDINDAKWLLENAGIDTSDKTLFQE